jgi:hypothetical protein
MAYPNPPAGQIKVRCRNCKSEWLVVPRPDGRPHNCPKCGAFLPTTPDAPGDTSTAVGAMGGAALGAAIAGPPGAIIGAVLGAMLGSTSKGLG